MHYLENIHAKREMSKGKKDDALQLGNSMRHVVVFQCRHAVLPSIQCIPMFITQFYIIVSTVLRVCPFIGRRAKPQCRADNVCVRVSTYRKQSKWCEAIMWLKMSNSLFYVLVVATYAQHSTFSLN